MYTITWSRFYQHWKMDVKLWFYFVYFQQICKFCFIYSLSNYLANTTTVTVVASAMFHGLWFDCLWATIWILFALLFFTLPSLFTKSDYIYKLDLDIYRRQYLGAIFTVVTTIIYIISTEYYRACKDIFNQFLFGIAYYDQTAVLKTIGTEHRVGLHITILSVIFAVLVLYILLSRYLIKIKNKYFPVNFTTKVDPYSRSQKIILSICIIFFYLFGLHGCIVPLSIQLQKSNVSDDLFLNKAIVSPYTALCHAIQEHLAIHNENGYKNIVYTKQHLMDLAKKTFKTNVKYAKLTDYMRKKAEGSKLNAQDKPKHIFLIVGESLDNWPLQKEYEEFDLTPNLKQIIRNGMYVKNFLPCANGTLSALNTIMSGLHDIELLMNYEKNSFKPYRTALALQFKNLGYKPQFFYGGYLTWQHLQGFAFAQGFSAVYGASDIKNWKRTNAWGGDDRTLFAFISKIIKTSTTPTFNIIMTTSNHPPFSIDLTKEGFAEKTVTKLLKKYSNTEMKVKELGHIWYADKAIGKFVKRMTNFDKTALFAITGDHFSFRHISPTPSIFDTSTVPLILYGNKIKQHYKFSDHVAGSHMDIGPTIIEMVAPKGFTYFAMGENLFAKNDNTLGIGQKKIITSNFITTTNTSHIMYFNPNKLPISSDQLNALVARYEQIMTIAWWLIKKSDELE